MALKWKRKQRAGGVESQCGRYRIAKTSFDFPCDCCGTVIQEWGLSVKGWKDWKDDKFRSLRDAKEWAEKVDHAMAQPVPDRGYGYCSCGTPLKKRAHLKCMLCYFKHKGVSVTILDIYPELLYPHLQEEDDAAHPRLFPPSSSELQMLQEIEEEEAFQKGLALKETLEASPDRP